MQGEPLLENDKLPGGRGSLIELLQAIQNKYDYLPEEILRQAAAITGKSLIEVYQVATFYKSFSLTPRGKHKVTVCCGTACHVRGSESVAREISKALGIMPGGTTPDGLFSLEKVNCLGACALAPLAVIDHEYHGNMTPARARKLIVELAAESGCRCAQEKVDTKTEKKTAVS